MLVSPAPRNFYLYNYYECFESNMYNLQMDWTIGDYA